MLETLSDIGEEEIINRIKRFASPGQLEDDTAEISCKNNILINNDLLVENIHFTRQTSSSKDVGWKCITSNLSDLAASGMEEVLGVTVGLVAPSSTPWEWVEGVYEGISQALSTYGGKLLGGDCSKGSQIIISITAIGTVGPLRLHQSHAKPEDWIVCSGPHGLSRLGFALLTKDPFILNTSLSDSLKLKAIEVHQRPQPPLNALRTLINCKPNNIPWRAAGTDSSDGLLGAIKNLCKKSKCQALIPKNSLPKHDLWPVGSHWDEWCINGGEDYELVLSLPKEWAQAMLTNFPKSFFIGYMQRGEAKIVFENNQNLSSKISHTFQHF